MEFGKTLITGGSGSLGQAIVNRATEEGWQGDITVYSRDEVKQAAMRDRFPDVRYVLGDVENADRLGRAMADIETVIHAAAFKRVPEAESQTLACIGANVIGSVNVAREAVRAGVARVVGISTDKACEPATAYGMSKALMERLFMSHAPGPGTTFHLVRYGNVLGSRGSVVPMFQAQAAKGGPITLTDPTMTRFWLTIEDAVDLVIAAAEAPSGTVLVPRCPSSDMATLADAVAPGVQQVTVGLRSAEKRHEDLLSDHEAPYANPLYDPDQGWHLYPLVGDPYIFDAEGYGSLDARALDADELRAAINESGTRLL